MGTTFYPELSGSSKESIIEWINDVTEKEYTEDDITDDQCQDFVNRLYLIQDDCIGESEEVVVGEREEFIKSFARNQIDL